MFDFLMTEEQKKLRDEARDLARWVPKELILAMDREEIQFPHEFLNEAGKRNLLGIRLPKKYGGRGLKWVDDIIVAEEAGVASYSLACLWGVGADIVCEAIIEFVRAPEYDYYSADEVYDFGPVVTAGAQTVVMMLVDGAENLYQGTFHAPAGADSVRLSAAGTNGATVGTIQTEVVF